MFYVQTFLLAVEFKGLLAVLMPQKKEIINFEKVLCHFVYLVPLKVYVGKRYRSLKESFIIKFCFMIIFIVHRKSIIIVKMDWILALFC